MSLWYTIDLPYSSISTNTHCIPILPLTKNQNGISSTVGGGFGSSLLVDAVDDIWVLTAVTTGVVETAVEATIELGVGMGVSEAGAAAGMGGGGGLFIMCHVIRSRVATESSTEEWPTLARPFG